MAENDMTDIVGQLLKPVISALPAGMYVGLIPTTLAAAHVRPIYAASLLLIVGIGLLCLYGYVGEETFSKMSWVNAIFNGLVTLCIMGHIIPEVLLTGIWSKAALVLNMKMFFIAEVCWFVLMVAWMIVRTDSDKKIPTRLSTV